MCATLRTSSGGASSARTIAAHAIPDARMRPMHPKLGAFRAALLRRLTLDALAQRQAVELAVVAQLDVEEDCGEALLRHQRQRLAAGLRGARMQAVE